MDLLHAAQLNKEGARALVSNNANMAFEYFRNALELLLTREIVLSGGPTLARAVNSLLRQPHLYHRMLWTSDASNGTSHEVDPRIFSKTFVFQPEEDSECSLALRINIYLALIFFNLAATIHQKSGSLRYPEPSLHVALELYDCGFDLLLQEEGCGADDWATNISLAFLNNMADIHWALSDFAKASRVLELQKGLLDIIYSNKRPHSYSEQEMEMFIVNTHVMQAPCGAAAA